MKDNHNYHIVEQYFDNLINYAKMKEESKYYTPTIEEFHVGFEYQIWNDSIYGDENGEVLIEGTTWINRTIGRGVWDLRGQVKRLLDKGKIRVKHLDKSDIESLGFESTDSTPQYVKGEFGLSLLAHGGEQPYRVNITRYSVGGEGFTRHFYGIPKNKSELQRVLKMIGI